MTRARLRFTVYRLENGWFQYVNKIESAVGKAKEAAVADLTAELVAAESLFSQNPYFMNADMTLVDTNLVPFLWRLEHYGLDWEALPKALRNYAHRMFQSKAFKKSITESEREYRFDF
nr:glutathione S-transferase C-terminal domain-containing protein [Marinicella sp. NBU2979]